MFVGFMSGFGILIGYFAVCAACALSLHRFVAVPAENFRKLLHFILLGSVFVLTYSFEKWWLSVAASLLFVALVFPALAMAERVPGYSRLLIERKDGEIKNSLIIVFVMFAVLISVCWGWIGERYLVIASALAWGFGDAAAALVGKRFGKHHIEGKFVEGRKSLEGTLAMFIVSFITVVVILLANGSVALPSCIPIAIITAAACTVVELYTRGGLDTITCPLTAAFILIPLINLWGT